MSTIDEIMGAVGRHGDDCIRDADTASESFEGLRDLIAAALADAERKGAEAMRTQLAILTPEMASAACWRYTTHSAGDYARAVGAAPLPTGPRQAVLLTDAAIAEAFLSRCPGHLRGEHDVRDMQARPDVMAPYSPPTDWGCAVAEIDDDISALRTVLRESDWAFESHQYSTEWQYTASCDRISRIVAHIDAQAAEIKRMRGER